MGNLLTSNTIENSVIDSPSSYRLKASNSNVQLYFETKFNNIIGTPFQASTPDRLVFLKTQVGSTCRQIVQEKNLTKIRYELNNDTWTSWIDDSSTPLTPFVDDIQEILGKQGLDINDKNQYPLILNGNSSIGTINKWGINIPVTGNSLYITPRAKDDNAWVSNSSLMLSNEGTNMVLSGNLIRIIPTELKFASNTNTNGYNFNASSEYTPDFKAFNAFNGNTSSNIGFWHTSTAYSNTGVYVGSASTVVNTTTTLKGEWLQVQLPTAFVLTAYGIYDRPLSSYPKRYPKNWYILGSNDGLSWLIVDTKLVDTNPNTDISKGMEIMYKVTQNFIPFTFFRIVFLSTIGDTVINLSQFNLYTNKGITINSTNSVFGDITAQQQICIGSTCVTENDLKKIVKI